MATDVIVTVKLIVTVDQLPPDIKGEGSDDEGFMPPTSGAEQVAHETWGKIVPLLADGIYSQIVDIETQVPDPTF